MKKIFHGIFIGIKNSLERFPLTIGITTTCVILLIYMSEITTGTNNDFIETLGRITMVIALGVPFSLSIKLFFEGLESYKSIHMYISYLISTVFLILYYYFFLQDIKMVSMSRYIGFSLVLYLIFLFISYLPNRDEFEFFVIRIFTRFFTTILYSLVLYLGLAAILFTIDKLLGVNVNGELYYYTYLIVAGIFAPTFFLAGIKVKNEILTIKEYSRLLLVLVLYIIMPLICVYTVILYIYFGKIIITRQWPEGLVSHLVLWYSAITATVLFFITPLLHEKTWPRKFMRYFPKAILPLIVMMFISIGIRINAYGVTENRYFVVALGIWTFLVMIYFSTIKKLINIVLPISLAVITTISIFGPLSSYSVSKYNQNKRLNKIFAKNNMVLNNKVVKSNTKVSDADSTQITSIVNYFENKHSLTDIKGLPDKFKTAEMESILGVKYIEENNQSSDKFYYFNSISSSDPIDINGYEYLFISNNNVQQQNNVSKTFTIDFDNESSTLKITKDNVIIYKKDLMDFANILIDKYGTSEMNKSLTQEEMSFEDETDKVKIKIQLSNVSINKSLSNDKIQSKDFQFYVLFNMK
ncbi:DUF4153 domain-containing protein [Clostridium lacusfryxellense]|uniref:DUF4153 domain-containing protein n=1 Tax=Clostridium lacusfryxellense TaxID=205328 RepID=UPI001C0D37FF|nr:DUF4153 domain-containing protein [Clostridium lacusfryxellense]MBU3111340.1 DUF4153 domain-containing protein [Clostridium lacusfryxellense]